MIYSYTKPHRVRERCSRSALGGSVAVEDADFCAMSSE